VRVDARIDTRRGAESGMSSEASPRFGRLDSRVGEQDADATVAGLDGWQLPAKMLLDALQPIEYLRESAWLGHIPFLFSLMGLHRPRRFVELGTHNGASFFSACQAVRDNGIDCECVAIDHWMGDVQAGVFTEQVFDDFHATLTQDFPGIGTFVRADFAEAANEFADGSIDLLHIDGFHSYEAVSTDLETFRNKLRERAVVIFHDVNEFQTSFGTWRFWRELEEQHPRRTMFFGHWHGLGVLSLDVDPLSPVNQLMDRCADGDLLAFLQHYYVSIYANEARAQIRVREAVMSQRERVDAAKAQTAEARVRAAEAATQADKVRASYESSTSWRVTRPLRALRGRTKG